MHMQNPPAIQTQPRVTQKARYTLMTRELVLIPSDNTDLELLLICLAEKTPRIGSVKYTMLEKMNQTQSHVSDDLSCLLPLVTNK